MRLRGSPDPAAVVWIRLAPIALLLIIGATTIPADFRSPATELISWSLDPRDFVLNLLLFIPLGAALSGRRWVVVLAALGLLSLSIEVLQLAQAGRHAGPADILANVAGGGLGSRFQHVRSSWLSVEGGYLKMSYRPFLAVALVGGLGLLLAIAVPGKPHDFSNWDPTYRLAISDEITRDRSWGGTLVAWAIYDRAIPGDDIRDWLGRQLPDDMKFSFGQLPFVPVGYWDNPDPRKRAGFLEMSPDTAAKVYERLERTGTMSLLAWFRVNDLEQLEDERIVTFSRDQFHRNFTLTQNGGSVGFRLRTPTTGLNGFRPHAQTMEILEPGRDYFVAATYDGFVSRVFVDGELMARENLAASGAAIPGLHDTSLPLVLALCGGCVAGGLIASCGRARRSVRVLLGCAGGLVVVAAVYSLGATPAWPVNPVSPFWRLTPPIMGGLVVAFSLTVAPFEAGDRARIRMQSR